MKVKCITTEKSSLTKGKVYEVIRQHGEDEKFIRVINDKGKPESYFDYRFEEPVEEYYQPAQRSINVK